MRLRLDARCSRMLGRSGRCHRHRLFGRGLLLLLFLLHLKLFLHILLLLLLLLLQLLEILLLLVLWLLLFHRCKIVSGARSTERIKPIVSSGAKV